MSPDKRDECGCHRDCYTGPGDLLAVEGHELDQWCRAHPCTALCVWPGCLTKAESDELLAEIAADP